MLKVDTALTGLKVESMRLGVSAHNIANQNTDGFKSSRVVASSLPTGGVEGRMQLNETPGPPVMREQAVVELSNTDVGSEQVTRILAAASFRANLKVLETAEEVTGTLVDLSG